MPYRLSFTTGGLFMAEAPLLASRYLSLQDWVVTREQVLQENLLQVRTASAGVRISKELIARLELLNNDELEVIAEGALKDRGHLLWAAVCRRYALIAEFAREVLREYHLMRRHQLQLADYDTFYSNKAVHSHALEALAASTQTKLRQNLFRMLREVGFVSEEQRIQAVQLSPSVANLLARGGMDALAIFPSTDHEIQRWLK